jgi:hypothetical protein
VTTTKRTKKSMVDCSNEPMQNWEQIDLAVRALLSVAFAQRRADPAAVQAMLSDAPTAVEVVDAVFAYRRRLGPIPDERALRAQAGTVMALFLLLGNWMQKISPKPKRGSSAVGNLQPVRLSLPFAVA